MRPIWCTFKCQLFSVFSRLDHPIHTVIVASSPQVSVYHSSLGLTAEITISMQIHYFSFPEGISTVTVEAKANMESNLCVFVSVQNNTVSSDIQIHVKQVTFFLVVSYQWFAGECQVSGDLSDNEQVCFPHCWGKQPNLHSVHLPLSSVLLPLLLCWPFHEH